MNVSTVYHRILLSPIETTAPCSTGYGRFRPDRAPPTRSLASAPSSSSACARCCTCLGDPHLAVTVIAGRRDQGQGQHGGPARGVLARRGPTHRPLHLAAPGQLARAHLDRRRTDLDRARAGPRRANPRRRRGPAARTGRADHLRGRHRLRSTRLRAGKIDVAVLEVGVGGRFDATNVSSRGCRRSPPSATTTRRRLARP